MSHWVSFRELRKHLTFEQVFRHYGITLNVKKEHQHVGPCPLPEHQGNRKSTAFSANLDRKIFRCFGCNAGGNILDFVALKQGFNPKNGDELRKAALFVQETFFGIVSESLPAQPMLKLTVEETAKPVRVNEPLDFTLKGLDATHPYLAGRGFTAATIAEFGLGFCKRGSLAGRIGIPLHDNAGRLIGYAGRLVDESAISDENPKYRFPAPRQRDGIRYEFGKTEFLYHGCRITEPARSLIVVEGFPALWWLVQHGYRNTVALMGSDCSATQAELLVARLLPDGCCIVFTDGDDAGGRGAADVFLKVGTQRRVRRVPLAANRQPTDCPKAELAELLRGL
jgi:DNA primase